MRWSDLEEPDVGGVGGRGGGGEVVRARGEARASIRLSPEAAEVWAGLDKASKASLGAFFNEVIVWYGRTRRHPIPPARVALEAMEMAARGFEACKFKLEEAEAEIERLRGEVEEAKAKLRSMQELEARLREAEVTTATLKGELSTAETKLKQCNERIEHYRRWAERLAQIICPHLDKLKTTIADQKATIELEALCWRKRET
jgi:DNA repair exonuclease SbcCD ATPase subunit